MYSRSGHDPRKKWSVDHIFGFFFNPWFGSHFGSKLKWFVILWIIFWNQSSVQYIQDSVGNKDVVTTPRNLQGLKLCFPSITQLLYQLGINIYSFMFSGQNPCPMLKESKMEVNLLSTITCLINWPKWSEVMTYKLIILWWVNIQIDQFIFSLLPISILCMFIIKSVWHPADLNSIW